MRHAILEATNTGDKIKLRQQMKEEIEAFLEKAYSDD